DRWQAAEVVADVWQLDLPRDVPPGDYSLRLTLYDSADSQAVGSVELGQVRVVDRRRQFERPPMQHQLDVHLGDAIRLAGYDLFQEPLTGEARAVIRLYWQALAAIPADYTVFVQVIGPDGQLVGQHDSIPAGNVPTTTWHAGEIITDQHVVDFETALGGEYRLIVGMYDSISGVRLPIANAGGDTIGDFWVVHTFAVTAER
ncbi:MAG: hypothetical protein R3264_19725, partial [Anaerolineae bacterium]|nr:hypothetical protein [Anaerolineae bacterium]